MLVIRPDGSTPDCRAVGSALRSSAPHTRLVFRGLATSAPRRVSAPQGAESRHFVGIKKPPLLDAIAGGGFAGYSLLPVTVRAAMHGVVGSQDITTPAAARTGRAGAVQHLVRVSRQRCLVTDYDREQETGCSRVGGARGAQIANPVRNPVGGLLVGGV